MGASKDPHGSLKILMEASRSRILDPHGGSQKILMGASRDPHGSLKILIGPSLDPHGGTDHWRVLRNQLDQANMISYSKKTVKTFQRYKFLV